MKTNPAILTKQIQRLMLSEADRVRLLEELKTLDEDRIQQLSVLVREHDTEALQILNQKASERQAVKENIMAVGSSPEAGVVGEEEMKSMVKSLEEIFRNPRELAEFFLVNDDYFLQQLENLFVTALKGNEQYQDEFRRFFTEVRLQKAALARQDQEEEKKLLIEAIEKSREQSKMLDEVIAKAEKALRLPK